MIALTTYPQTAVNSCCIIIKIFSEMIKKKPRIIAGKKTSANTAF